MSKPMSRLEQVAVQALVRTMGGVHAWIYRKSGGAMGGRVAGGAPIMLLTTTGRHSGKPRTTPLIYLRDGDKLIVVASKGGYPTHPAWYLNLKQNPQVEVQIGNERESMLAETATSDKKAQYWPRVRAVYPPYHDYQERTQRDIPVVVLRPLTNGRGNGSAK
jgi:deazaflavin-dependent oxidoreductase (nitroreductase family)